MDFSTKNLIENSTEMGNNQPLKGTISQPSLSSFIENAPDAIVVVNNAFETVLVNKKFQELCHYVYGEAPSENVQLENWFNQFSEVEPLVNWELILGNKEGYIIDNKDLNLYYQVKGSKNKDEEDNLCGYFIRFVEISAFLKTDKKDGEIDQKFQLLKQAVSPILWTTNADGEFEEEQPTWEKYTGQNMEKFEGFGWIQAFHPEDQEKIMQDWTDSVQFKSNFTGSGRIFCQSTNLYHYFESFAIPIHDTNGKVKSWFGCIIDKQEIKKQKTIQETTLVQLEETVAELEGFAYIASHDLQEPLRMVTSYLQLIENRYSYLLDSKGRSFVNYTIESANRMKTLIEDLLNYSRISYKKDLFTWVDLNKVMETILDHLQRLVWERNAKIECEKLPIVRAIPLQMQQLFQNLITNAIKFCPEHRQLKVKITCTLVNSSWLFAITDNGIGISEEYRDKIFEVFQRLNSREKYEGNGIGLSICKKIVKNHKGKIWVESNPDEETTFYFTLENQLR